MKYICLILVVALTGCYGPKKATRDFSRAVAYDAGLLAESCARTYPTRDTTIHDTTTVTDTTVLPGEVQTDTVTINDTVRITTVVTKPGQTITNTVTIRDTIRVTNTASVEACRLENTKLVAVITPITSDRDKFKKRSRIYLWILIAAGAVIGAGVYAKVAGIFKPKLKSV